MMTDRIARLGKETALYGLSTVVGRLLNFLLVPLYANYLLPEENGVIATIYAYVAFFVVVFGLGMEQSFMRHWVDASEDDRPRVLRIAMVGVLPGIGVSAILVLMKEQVAELIGYGPDETILIALAAGILALDNLAVVPYALLRMERKALQFAFFKLAGIIGTMGLTVFLVVYQSMGAEGVFWANAIASAAVAVALLVRISPSIRWAGVRMSEALSRMKDLLRFGIPLVPAGLAGIALQVIDKPLMKSLTDDATVGLYQLNARLAIFMMLAVGMFDFAWRPFFLQHSKDPDAKELFSKVFTYFSVFLLGIFLAVSLFVEDLVRLPIGESTFFPEFYWQGTGIIPVFLVANLLTGAYVVFLTGVYIQKKTGIVPLISGTAALVTIAGILVLVPMYGIMGGAVAAFAGHLVQTVWMYVVGQRAFYVRYEWTKVLMLCVLTATLYGVAQALAPEPLTLSGVLMKVGALAVFLLSLPVLRIVSYGGLKEVLTIRFRSR